MHLLREIHEQDIWWITDLSIKLKPRKAVRAVLKRKDWKIAMLYVGKWDYHKLPWGWIELWEDKDISLQREIEEEVGCSSTKWQEIWVIIEYRQEFEQVQTSYCYESSTEQEIFTPNFTEKELKNKFELRRYSLDEAISAVKNDTPKKYEWKFIQIRDL